MQPVSTAPVTNNLDLYDWTVEKYRQAIEAGVFTERDRIELLDGQIVKMSPISKYHAACLKKLTRLFYERTGSRYIISVQDPVILDDKSEPEPDLAILSFKADFYAGALPRAEDILLIVEISGSTLKYDREYKTAVYAAAGIPEYWIVNLNEEQLEQHLAPLDGVYQQIHIWKRKQRFFHEWLGDLDIAGFLLQTA
jgi:Uma2 family endonuclease